MLTAKRIVLVVLLLGTVFALGFFVRGVMPKKSEAMPVVVAPIHPSADELVIRQDGNIRYVSDLVSDFETNPTRFKIQTKNSKFEIEGAIQKIGEKWGVEDTTGFFIPLRPPADLDETYSVGIFVLKLGDTQLAALNPGQRIIVNCPRIRAFNTGLVFDDCQIAGKQ